MSGSHDSMATPLPDDLDGLRDWALGSAQEVLGLRDRLIGAEAAKERAEASATELRAEVERLRGERSEDHEVERLVAERIAWEREVIRLGKQNYEMNGTLHRITSTRVWRFGRALRAPLQAFRLWK
jgi:hypothetical protein